MNTDTLWQILAVASFAAAVLAAGALGGWALYRNGRRDEAIARDEDGAWWDTNARRAPDPEPPELAVVAGVTPLPRREPGAALAAAGWTPQEQWRRAAGLTDDDTRTDDVEIAQFEPGDDESTDAPAPVKGRSS